MLKKTQIDPHEARGSQRKHSLRGVFNAVRYLVRAVCPWRLLPNDLPLWWTVPRQVQRWIIAGCFELLADGLQAVLSELAGRAPQPTVVILDGCTIQSTNENGERADYDGDKRKKGSKVHVAVDTSGRLLALKVTSGNGQGRAQVAELIQEVQAANGDNVEAAFVDRGYTGQEPAAHAARVGVCLIVVMLEETKRCFVLLPTRWVVECSCAWVARFRQLRRDFATLPSYLAQPLWLAFVMLSLNSLLRQSP